MALKKDLEKTRGKNLIVLDIGSQFLKALFLEVDKKQGKGILRSWAKERVVDDLEKLYPICEKAIKKIEKKSGLKGEEIFLGLRDEIIKGISTNFCYRRERPNQKIDLPELKYFVQKAQWKAFDKIRKQFASETGFSETEVRLVNAHIVNIKVDGNFISNPLGFKGKNFCLTIFNSYTFGKWLEDLLRIASQLKLELIGITSSSYALFHSLSANENVLIIDVGGKVTEVSLIKNGGEVVETRSFDLGGCSFSRTIADFLDLEPEEAEAIKMKYSKGEVSAGVEKKIEKLLSSNISSWLAGVKVVLDEFLKQYKLRPSKIFLCGGGSSLPGIKEILKKKGDFQIKFISPLEFIKIENRTKLEDIPCLSLANLALEMPEATVFSSTLKRVVRLIQEH